MLTLDHHPSGRHFLQIPGPSPVPDRILRAMSLPTIDHRGPEFGALGLKVLDGLKQVFRTRHPVAIYPASGTGAWEAALVNVLSPGDAVLMVETGHFATLWQKMAQRLGLKPEFLSLPGTCGETGLPLAWRHGVHAELIAERLRADTGHRDQGRLRGAQRDLHRRHQRHRRRARARSTTPGTRRCCWSTRISGLASADYRHDEWGVDVTVSGSQKGLMLPPGISFNALSPKALAASKTAHAAHAPSGPGTRSSR